MVIELEDEKLLMFNVTQRKKTDTKCLNENVYFNFVLSKAGFPLDFYNTFSLIC